MYYYKIRLFLFLLIFITLYLSGCTSQKNMLSISGFSEGKMKYRDGNNEIDSSKLINRKNKNKVQLSFFAVFDDSIVLYINKKQIWTGNVYEKNNPFTSSDWCGFDLNFLLIGSENIATIKLVKQKQYIQFHISQEYPKYMIQRYDNIWYVRSLNNNIDLK